MPIPSSAIVDATWLVLVGPSSSLAERIAQAALHRGAAVRRRSVLHRAPSGLSMHAILVIADTQASSCEICSLDERSTGAPLLRITSGRLMSASRPAACREGLVELIASAGVRMSAGMRLALLAQQPAAEVGPSDPRENATFCRLHYTT